MWSGLFIRFNIRFFFLLLLPLWLCKDLPKQPLNCPTPCSDFKYCLPTFQDSLCWRSVMCSSFHLRWKNLNLLKAQMWSIRKTCCSCLKPPKWLIMTPFLGVFLSTSEKKKKNLTGLLVLFAQYQDFNWFHLSKKRKKGDETCKILSPILKLLIIFPGNKGSLKVSDCRSPSSAVFLDFCVYSSNQRSPLSVSQGSKTLGSNFSFRTCVCLVFCWLHMQACLSPLCLLLFPTDWFWISASSFCFLFTFQTPGRQNDMLWMTHQAFQ